MISTAYDQRRETVRFVWRNVPFAFAVFGPRRGPKRNEGESLTPQGAMRSIPPDHSPGLEGGSRKRPGLRRPWSALRGRFPAPQNEVFGTRRKERKSCAKEVLSRCNH
jgi:hypothetical protein